MKHQHWLPRVPGSGNLPLRAVIAVGFGRAQVTRNGAVVYDANHGPHTGMSPYVEGDRARKYARRARAEPDVDWRIVFDAPLWSATYQWQAGFWRLVEQGRGFA